MTTVIVGYLKKWVVKIVQLNKHNYIEPIEKR